MAVTFVATVLPAPVALAYPPVGGLEAGAPVLISPIDDVSVTSAPILRWKADVSAIGYGVKVWAAGNPGAVLCEGSTAELWTRCDALPAGSYLWTIQSIGIEGRLGGISAVGAFTRAAFAIAAPALVSPANTAVLDYPDALGILQWAPAAGADRYQLQVSTSPTFAEGAPDLLYASGYLSADVPREHIGVPQYWRVRGVNADKTWAGPWSATRSFTVNWTDTSAQLLPGDGASVSNIVLSWTPVKGATDYEFEITTIGDTDFSDAIRTTPTWPNAYWSAWGATPAGDLRWRVRARNDYGGVTAWSGARTIHRDAGAPAAIPPSPVAPPSVSLVSPLDEVTVPSSSEVQLTWTPAVGAIGYELAIRSSTGPWSVLPRVVGAAPIRWRFDPGETFGWRVRALGENGQQGPWSSERSITVANPAPLTLISPSDGADVPGSDQVVTWQPVAGSFNYRLEVSDNAGFVGWTDPGGGLNATSGSLRVPHAGRWYWRVRAGFGGTDALSEVRAVDVIDDLAPAGQVWLSGGWTAQTTIGVDLAADDALGDVVEVQLSGNGTTWETHAFPINHPLDWSLTSTAHGGSTPGQRHVHARYRDDAGNWSAIASASIWYGMEPPIDDAPPSGTISVAHGAAFTRTRYPVIDIPASDVSGVRTIALSTDGVNWIERPYWPEQQVSVSAANGTKTVWVKWKDWIGHWSAAKSDSIVLDTVAPTATAPTRSFSAGTIVNSGLVPTKFSWTGADATSGVARYEAAISTDAGAYSTISTSLVTGSLTRNLAGGHAYRLRVRAVDKAGNVGAWAYGPTFSISAYQESSTRITYTGTWSRPASSSYWGGYERYATAAGAKASITFTGKAFAWIGCTGAARGSAKIYVNGVLTKTVSLYASTTTCRKVLLAMTWSTAVSRKISIVVSGTSGHSRVDLDALITGT